MKWVPYILVAVVLIVAGVFIWQKLHPDPVLPPPPAAGNSPTATGPAVHHGDPSLPKPDEHTTGVLRVTVPPDTVEGVPQGKPRDIFIYLVDDPKRPPFVRSQTPISATFHPVTDPWLYFKLRYAVGASLAGDGDVSPWGGIGVVRLFNRIEVGAGIDEEGIGVFASYQVWREFSVGAMWYALPVFDSDARAALVVSYTF